MRQRARGAEGLLAAARLSGLLASCTQDTNLGEQSMRWQEPAQLEALIAQVEIARRPGPELRALLASQTPQVR